MARRRFLLMYDIREDARLRAVHDIARSFGDSLQYSVFVCDLSAKELAELRGLLADAIHPSVDSVAIVDLGPAEASSRTRFFFLGQHPPLPASIARVV